MMKIEVPERENVSQENQQIFDQLKNNVGFVPNIYATLAHSDPALPRYMQFSNGKTNLNNKEKEVVNLVVSQINGCRYCQSAHTAMAKMNGFDDEQIIEIRKGHVPENEKLNALAKLAQQLTQSRGKVDPETLQSFFDVGYTKAHLVDTILAIADKTATNLLHNATKIPIDFPEAKELKPAPAQA